MEKKKPHRDESEAEIKTVALSEDATMQTRRASPHDGKPAAIKQAPLPPALSERARILYVKVGHLIHPTFEQWAASFCRDPQPEREIAVWEAIAAAYEEYMAQEPDADATDILLKLAVLATKGTFKEETEEIRKLRRLLNATWLNRPRR